MAAVLQLGGRGDRPLGDQSRQVARRNLACHYRWPHAAVGL